MSAFLLIEEVEAAGGFSSEEAVVGREGAGLFGGVCFVSRASLSRTDLEDRISEGGTVDATEGDVDNEAVGRSVVAAR